MPVYQSTLDLILDIKKRSRQPVLEPSHIDAVAAALAGARPCGTQDRGGADRGTPARRVIGVAEPAFPEDDN